MTNSSGEIVGLCGFARDQTQTRQLEAQLLQAQKMEAIGTLAGGISHDFNNLLQAILGYAQIMLLDKPVDDPEYGKLREIEKASLRATELTRQLLAFSRKVEIHPRPLDINQVVRQVEKLLKRTIPKMIEIELRLVDPILTVNADSGQLEQVLLNIGVNARDAMPDGGRMIIETTNVRPDETFRRIHLSDAAEEYVLLSISDTGQGMPSEVLDHIFEPFFTTKRPDQGTGLGLAMAYGIIKNHHGHISCDSQPDVGTTFHIYLPAIETAAESLSERREDSIEKGCGETVLVIDDEEFLRQLADDMLSKNGYNVLKAGSGEAGLSLYKQHMKSITFVILDLIMPGMGGKQCLDEILKINPKANVLIASGYAVEDPAKDPILFRAKGFIQKPYNFRHMLKMMRQSLIAKEI